MTPSLIPLDLIPSLLEVPAAAGAILPSLQIGGHTVFDVVVAIVVVKPA